MIIIVCEKEGKLFAMETEGENLAKHALTQGQIKVSYLSR